MKNLDGDHLAGGALLGLKHTAEGAITELSDDSIIAREEIAGLRREFHWPSP
jgi:hypothetical protein